MNEQSSGFNTIKKMYSLIFNDMRKQITIKKIDEISDEENSEKILIETAYTLVLKFMFIYLFSKASNIEELLLNQMNETQLKELYSEVRDIYPYIFEETLFDWYSPDISITRSCISLFHKIHAEEITNDIFGDLYESVLTKDERKKIGLFYTPTIIIDYILDNIDYKSTNDVIGSLILDPACGSGGFLVRATDRLMKRYRKLNENSVVIIEGVISSIYGFDIDPFACFLAETNILFQLLPSIKEIKSKNPEYKVRRINIFQTNTIQKNDLTELGTTQNAIKNRIGDFKDGFDFVVGNPPYIESKRMDPQTKLLCKSNFPKIAVGGFDIYGCFIKLGIDILRKDGKFGFIIPNKFMAAKYASTLREILLDKFTIDQIVDVSYLPVFKDAMVYPIILLLEKRKQLNNDFIKLIPEIEDLSHLKSNDEVLIEKEMFSFTEDRVFFFLPNDIAERDIIKTIINRGKFKLSELLTIRWSVSFHKKGLRKIFVSDSPKGKNPQKILGGKSFGGNKEIQRYSLKWNGYWIDYDEDKAKGMKNPFPNISLFKNKKMVICQYAKRMRCTIDENGFVCKDIFFIAKLTDKARNLGLSVEHILAYLNSKLASYFYSHIFAGAHVGGRYLHYLPLYLNSMPFPDISNDIKNRIANSVKELLLNNKNETNFKKIDEEIDNMIFAIYNLSNSQIEIILNNVDTKLELKNDQMNNG